MDTICHAKPQLRYACGLSASGYLLYVIAGPLAALGYDNAPEIYGLYTWPLILGWLAGAAFLFSATFCFTKATVRHPGKRKAVEFILAVLWFAAIMSALILFKAAGRHGTVNPWSGDPQLVGYGIISALAIIACTTLQPALLAYYFKRSRLQTWFVAFTTIASCLFFSTAAVVGLYACVWLDWRIGIDLYLSRDAGNVLAIERGLQWALLVSWVASVAMTIACVLAYRAIGKPRSNYASSTDSE